MKIEYKTVDKEKNIVQITCPDERWYGNPDIGWFPSVTFITSYYPKGAGYDRWLADKGMDKAEEVKKIAGEKGSAVHNAIDIILKGETINCDDKFIDSQTLREREYSAEEWEAINSFVKWWKSINAKILSNEFMIIDTDNGYGGTVDILAEIDGVPYIIDIKTSKAVYASHEIQISAYAETVKNQGLKDKEGKEIIKPGTELKLGIIQVGYQMNKNKYKFTEVENKFPLFLSVRKIWEEENKNVSPKQYELPTTIKI